MTRLRAGSAGLAMIAAVALMSGCTPDLRTGPLRTDPASPAPVVEPQPDTPAAVADALDCRSPSGPLSPTAGAEPIPPPGAVPEGFVVVAAHACGVEVRETGSRDGALHVVALVTRYEGDFGPLLAALGAPDEVAPPDMACALSMEIVPPLWLEGADGSVVSVRSPVDGCMKTKPAVREALAGLDAVSIGEWTPRD
ncbi:hypothetical protein ASE14_11450 [Agromyces sp. Root81]|uniref:hypothetical protein n=1 Tax=Agromyces sp. Root81 TaxID=1736601 RepID=UPI0006FB3E2C|nr:hypothetical protein [Agromyces sp. Root81]KRC61473.1 hypothetical protein ASE14_11450 [Agromyces sp. Root81]